MADLGAVKRKVAELEAKNEIDKAIAELEKAIQDFPKDGGLFNKLGDLYIKVNRQKQALDVYFHGAQVFKEETYFPNAIALCKKILRLDAERVDVFYLLGDLHRELGQRVEAANYLLEYADRKMKAGELEEALKSYNIVKDLVPNNAKVLQAISAIYQKLGKKEEGAELLQEAAQVETKQKEIKESIKTTGPAETTIIEKKPAPPVVEPPPVSPPPVEPPPAVVQPVTPAEPDLSLEDIVSPEVAELLKDQIQQSAEQTVLTTPSVPPITEEVPIPPAVERKVEDTAAVTEEPVSEVSSSGPAAAESSEIDKTIELAELYLNLGSEDEAIDCFRNAALDALNNKMYETALRLNKRIADLRPTDLKCRQQLVEIAQIMNDRDSQVAYLLELAEALNRRDARSQAQDVFRKVLEIDPDNTTAKEMLVEVSAPPRDFIDLGEVLRTEIEGEQKSDGLQNIQDLISQFRQEVFDSIGEGDYRSHYDLGVAYKGMGLHQEAIEEFEIAAKDINLRLKAYESIASCLMEKGKVEDAVKILNEALTVPNRPAREYFGIHFLLGNCYEIQSNLTMALKAFMNAYNIDKTVPDLTKKITDLRNVITDELRKKGRVTAPAAADKPVTPAPTKAPPAEKTTVKKSKVTYL